VFDRMPLEPFGNRIPQLAFEVFRAVDDLNERIGAMTVIPGASEFGYHTEEVKRVTGPGRVQAENVHSGRGHTDWSIAIDDLEASCPNAQSVALVVSWFGSDLRAGQCEVAPAVEGHDRVMDRESWTVGGLGRAAAREVSRVEGRPAYGGTPSDASVIAAIKDLKARGKDVVFYPFILMDIAEGNALVDPYNGASPQPVYPWRGLITCDPAPGMPGSPDKSAAAGGQIDAVFGTAAVSDFAVSGDTIVYSGPAEWSLRRMVLHYAHLCALAGGVDAFLIGSELRNLVAVRDSADHYPAVDRLIALAGAVRGILGSGTKISYAADWSEYFGHHPQDGSGDVYFHLDPLWADSAIDFIGIDNYMPLSDWRDGSGHADRLAGYPSIYDLDYLRGNIAGGEGYDWYYASAADRDNQVRTPITDGAAGKPWTFRTKDLKNWWSNLHFNRPGGVESATATAWIPQSKPIWFTEAGCPAIDRGTNQPNVFVDEKSSSSATPYYSGGQRDDLIQRQYLKALLSYWDPGDPAYAAGSNPVSGVYGGRMVTHDRIHIWTWDARPFPYFPQLASVWADGSNWERGHWITGRVGAAPIDRLVTKMLEDFGFAYFVVDKLYGIIDGYVVDHVMSARQALEPLGLASFFDAVESGGKVRFSHRDGDAVAVLAADDLVDEGEGARIRLTRAQESELPVAVQLTHLDSIADYRLSAVESRRLVGLSRRDARADLPLVLPFTRMQQIADIWLQDLWAAREGAAFALPPSRMAIEPGDNLDVDVREKARMLRIGEIAQGAALTIQAQSIEPAVFAPGPAAKRNREPAAPPPVGIPDVAIMDLPPLGGVSTKAGTRIAGFSEPWPGGLAVHRSRSGDTFEFLQTLDAPATLGRTLIDLDPGPVSRWDRGNVLTVRLGHGALSPLTQGQVLNGGNLAAIGPDEGPWEVIQFVQVELVDTDTYELSLLLRGQAGSEWAMGNPCPAGARFVLLDGAVDLLDAGLSDVGVPMEVRTGPIGLESGHDAFDKRSLTVGTTGLRPLSPVHVRAVRDGGDIELTWIRRGRFDADSWSVQSIPLGEAVERYEVDIFDGPDVVRTLTADETRVTYIAADRLADGIATPGPLTVAVTQLSQSVGRGFSRKVTIDV